MSGPLKLHICIPTYNRYGFLLKSLDILCEQIESLPDGVVKLSIFDNNDSTPESVKNKICKLTDKDYITYKKNACNIGSDRNIANAYNLNDAPFLWVLGDDDYILPGRLSYIMQAIEIHDPDIFILRACGYDKDYIKEVPKTADGLRSFQSRSDFLWSIGMMLTFISSIIIKRSTYSGVDTSKFVGTNLIQVGVVLESLANSKTYLKTDGYMLSCIRNNTGGYRFEKVFVENLVALVNKSSLVQDEKNSIFKAMVVKFLPQRLFVALNDRLYFDPSVFRTELMNVPGYNFFIYPFLVCPRPLCFILTPIVVLSRLINGDGKRMLAFLVTRILNILQPT